MADVVNYVTKSLFSTNKLRDVFNLIDTNRNGHIDAHELRQCIQLLLNYTVSKEDCIRLIDQFGFNNILNFEQFQLFITSLDLEDIAMKLNTRDDDAIFANLIQFDRTQIIKRLAAEARWLNRLYTIFLFFTFYISFVIVLLTRFEQNNIYFINYSIESSLVPPTLSIQSLNDFKQSLTDQFIPEIGIHSGTHDSTQLLYSNRNIGAMYVFIPPLLSVSREILDNCDTFSNSLGLTCVDYTSQSPNLFYNLRPLTEDTPSLMSNAFTTSYKHLTRNDYIFPLDYGKYNTEDIIDQIEQLDYLGFFYKAIKISLTFISYSNREKILSITELSVTKTKDGSTEFKKRVQSDVIYSYGNTIHDLNWLLVISSIMTLSFAIVSMLSILYQRYRRIDSERLQFEFIFNQEKPIFFHCLFVVIIFIVFLIYTLRHEYAYVDNDLKSFVNTYKYSDHTWNLSSLVDLYNSRFNAINELVYLRLLFCAGLFWFLLRLVSYIATHPRLSILLDTLSLAQSDLFHFFIIFSLIYGFLGFLAFIILGSTFSEFSTIQQSMYTQYQMLVGEWPMDNIDFEGTDLALVILYFASFCVIVFFVLLNLFLSIIVDAYSDAKIQGFGITYTDFFTDCLYLFLYRIKRLTSKWPKISFILEFIRNGTCIADNGDISTPVTVQEIAHILKIYTENQPSNFSQVMVTDISLAKEWMLFYWKRFQEFLVIDTINSDGIFEVEEKSVLNYLKKLQRKQELLHQQYDVQYAGNIQTSYTIPDVKRFLDGKEKHISYLDEDESYDTDEYTE